MAEDRDALRARADQCRRLARGVSTDELANALTLMANDYETQAAAAAAPQDEAPPAPFPPQPRRQGGR